MFYVWIDFDQDKNGLILIKTKWIDFEIWNLSSLSQDKMLNCVAPPVIYSNAFSLMILKSGVAIWSVLARRGGSWSPGGWERE